MAAERSRRRPRSTPKAPGTPPGTGSDVGPEATLAGQAPDASTEAMRAFMAWTASSPEFMQMYLRYLGESAELWRRQIASEPIGGQTAPAPSAAEDRRFSAPEWSSSPYFDFLRQSYLLTSRFLTTAVEVADVPDDGKGQLRFLARQYIDAVALQIEDDPHFREFAVPLREWSATPQPIKLRFVALYEHARQLRLQRELAASTPGLTLARAARLTDRLPGPQPAPPTGTATEPRPLRRRNAA